MNIKKILLGTAASALAFGSLAAISLAASLPPQRPEATDALPDTYNAGWVAGVSQDKGAQGQSIKLGDHSTDASDFAYYSFPRWWDQKLEDVQEIRANFLGDAGTDNTLGSPRFSLELDLPDNGIDTIDSADGDVAIYLDPEMCGDPAATGGGWTEADFTGDRTNCTLADSKGNIYVSDAADTAWNKLVYQYPDAKVWFMFLIQDATTGTNYVDRIMLDGAFITKQP